jgi:methionyl-tRNA synthetase
LDISKGLFVHGHILSEGKKMSKTLGNVISIDEMLEKFGKDGTRYLLLSAGNFGEDVDVTMKRLTEKYNADLANGLGNLVSRVITLISKSKVKNQESEAGESKAVFSDEFTGLIQNFRLDKAVEHIWKIVREANKHIEETKPWELAKSNEDTFEKVMTKLITDLDKISRLLQPFMPETAEKIKQQLKTREKEILFERIK